MSLIISLKGKKYEYYSREQAVAINKGLREIGILDYEFTPKVISKDVILPKKTLSRADIDYLKFIAAKLRENPKWIPPSNFINQHIPFELKQKFIAENKSHLICHSWYGALFVPVKFNNLSLPPLWLSEHFGFSINLLNELKEIAGRLEFELGDYNPDLAILIQQRFDELEDDPIGFEKILILYLYNFCLASIKYGLLISFS